MTYPEFPDYQKKISRLCEYVKLKHEYGAQGLDKPLAALDGMLEAALEMVKSWPECEDLRAKEPDKYDDILRLRPEGPRCLWPHLDEAAYADKLAGAWLSRAAGCTLGAMVEFWPIPDMEKWAAHIGDAFPPVDFWTRAPYPYHLRYGKSPCAAYTRAGMNAIPVDDDLAYTLLGLLIAEDYGPDFTVGDVGKAWLKYLPYACTAEEVALDNLRAGVDPWQAADINNPFCQWIGADIRSDPWAYMAPGCPEKAAAMAYRDAYISHRRNGIYGEMFFSAAQAAAFAVNDTLEAVRIGLTEIPAECALHRDVVWALETAPSIKDYKAARAAVDEQFIGMSGVHTNINACLTVFGLAIGGRDVTRVLSETVAMGLDNDCTAATAGSIVGAVVGKSGMPAHWYERFGNKVESYLIGHDCFAMDDLMTRFTAQARRIVGAQA